MTSKWRQVWKHGNKLLKNLSKALISVASDSYGVPDVGDVVVKTWDNWDKDSKLQEKLAELQQYAQARVDEFMAAIKESLDESELELGKVDPTRREMFEAWMAQIQPQLRRAWRRPADPRGTTVPAGTVLRSPADLQELLPSHFPKFKAGDKPVPGYELVEPLGSGGFSDVWKARKVGFNQLVAAKIGLGLDDLRSRLGPNVPADADPLRHEFSVHCKLAAAGVKEGILTSVDAFLDQMPSCLIYEYVPDGDLVGVIHELHTSGNSPKAICKAAREFVHQLACYLKPAHAAGVVHRDLKPANILIMRGVNGEWAPRIADFGIGGLIADHRVRSSQTTAGFGRYQTTMMKSSHTLLYASPQQVGMHDTHPADDIYAVGVVLFQMITGDLLVGALAMPPNWIARLEASGASRQTIDIVGRCLDPERSARIQDAGELCQEIERQQRMETGESQQTAHLRALRQKKLLYICMCGVCGLLVGGATLGVTGGLVGLIGVNIIIGCIVGLAAGFAVGVLMTIFTLDGHESKTLLFFTILGSILMGRFARGWDIVDWSATDGGIWGLTIGVVVGGVSGIIYGSLRQGKIW